ncbi:MAG: BtrH N-terminal domain-containing protein [Pseudomonadota bacterium]
MRRVEVEGFEPFIGQHCETVATGSLLKAAGMELTEPVMFGLGEALGFIMINLSSLPLPFVGGRSKPFALTETLCRNLKLECLANETASRKKAWAALEAPLARGVPVGLQLDCFHLDYFSRPVHFAGHFVAAFGMDARAVSLVDTEQQGSLQRVSRLSLEDARFAKGPMAAKARSWTIEGPLRAPDLPGAARTAIRANAKAYLAPPFKGASFLGIRKLADSLPHWQALAPNPRQDLELSALLMERAGTGGALFRNFYRDFLEQAAEWLGRSPALVEAQRLFANSASEWTAVAALIDESARSGESAPLIEAAARCRQIAELEITAMTKLASL